jgi:glycogen operon protein
MAARVLGSGDVYDHRGRRPTASINFLTSHDGFTLNDLVSYEGKHNEANGEDNRDGSDDNRSCNYGAEGPTDDPVINGAREKQRRNLLATLFLSHGAPMLLAGDEFARSQMGNNNAYCQDSEIGWIHWSDLPPEAEALGDFTRDLIRLRQENEIFRRASWRDGCMIRWLNPGGGDQIEEHWDDVGANTIGLWLANPNLGEGARQALILFNPHDGDVLFKLPDREGGWRLALDTAREHPDGGQKTVSEEISLSARSLTVLL